MADEDRIAGVLEEFFERRDRGDELSPDDLVKAHPDIADELRSHFEILGLYDREFSGPGLPPGVPRQVGDFTVLREIGRGGMAVVYEAEQVSMGRRVALKLLSPHITSSRQAVTRFRREARAAGQLHHTNIVPVHAMGEDQGLWYFAMELVEGPALSEVIDAMRPAVEGEAHSASATDAGRALGTTTQDRGQFRKIAEMMAGVAEALQAAHDEGIIHRDVKPANLLLHADGTLKLVDFGLARLSGEGASMTVTGQLIGTPYYMSPEQAMAKRVRIDERTDIYSLGATIYELLALDPPFRGDSIQDVCSQIISKDPPLMRKVNPRIPKDLETIVLKAMEKDRGKRYQTAGEMAKDLRRFAEGMPIRARRVSPVERVWRKVKRNKIRAALVAAVVLLAAAGVFFALRSSREEERRTVLEYATLCAQAAGSMARHSSIAAGGEFRSHVQPGDSTEELYTRAIDLRPDRPEAYLGRALAPGRGLDQRLADLDAAHARGLPEGTWRLARALHFRIFGRTQEAAKEERLAPPEPRGSLDSLLRGFYLTLAGRRAEAHAFLDHAIEISAPGSVARIMALNLRFAHRQAVGDLPGALKDLHALQELGDESYRVSVAIASIWRRLGNEKRALEDIQQVLRQVRERGTEAAWLELCRACQDYPNLRESVAVEALRVHGGASRFLLERGCALRAAGRYEEALDVFDQVLSRDRMSRDARENRACSLAGLGRWEEALREFDAVVAAGDVAAIVQTRRASCLTALRRREEALEAARLSQDLDPADPATLRDVGVGLMNLGRNEEALQLLRRVMDVCPDDALAHSWAAQALLGLDRKEEALQAANRAIELGPNERAAHYARGNVLREFGELDEALAELSRAVELDPLHAEAHCNRGSVLHDLGRSEEAIKAFRRAIELKPWILEPYVGLVNALVAREQIDDALLVFRAAIDRNPSDPDIYNARAIFLSERLGRHEAALADIDKALELEPNHGRWERKAQILWALRRFDEALPVIEKAIETDPICPHPYWQQGEALGALGKHERALASFEEALRLDPKHTSALISMGALLAGAYGKIAECLRCMDRAIEIDPGIAQAWANRGLCLLKLNRSDDAHPSLLRALELDPSCEVALRAIGHSLYRKGLEKEALQAHEKCIELGIADVNNMNSAAWTRANSSDPELRDPAHAVAYARSAVRLAPGMASVWNTLGVALYRVGDWEEAVRALARSMELGAGGSVHDWLFVAMARWRLGVKDEALRWFRRAEDWMEKQDSQDEELDRIRSEAAELLGVEK